MPTIRFSVLIVAGGILSCLILASTVAISEPPAKIKIGISVPLTGEAATYGTDMKNAFEFANRELAGGRYELLFEDDKCSGKDAVTAARKFVDIEKVKYVLGFGCSGALLSAAPIFEKAQVLVIAAGTSAADISKSGDYIFRTCPSDDGAALSLASWLKGKVRKLAIVSAETSFAQGLHKAFTKEVEKLNITTVSESFLPDSNDFRSILVKLRASQPDGLVMITQAEPSTIALVNQVNQLGWKVPLYNFYHASSSTFQQAVGNSAGDIVFSDAPTGEESLDPQGLVLFKKFLLEYGQPQSMDFYSASAIASFAALHETIQSGQEPRQYLYTHTFSGIFKPFSFDANGDALGFGQVIRVLKNGKVESLN